MLPHPIIRVTRCQQVGTYKLHLDFDDGASQTIDFWPVLRGEIFEPLRDPNLFAQVRIDPDFHTLVWPNDADFDPATLRHWPEYLPYMVRDDKGSDEIAPSVPAKIT
jgi:hypothetical protein